MSEGAFDDVRDAFDVAMRMKRPDGAGDQAIVVEDAERPPPHVVGIAVLIEREVPARREPSTLGCVDLLVAPDDDHGTILDLRSRRRPGAHSTARLPA